MVGTEKRRRRPAVSCELCRKRKIRCNRQFPCSNCLRSKNATCSYDSSSAPQVSGIQTPTTLSTASSQRPGEKLSDSSSRDFESSSSLFHHSISVIPSAAPPPPSASEQDSELMRLKLRIRQLEYQLSNPPQHENTAHLPKPMIETTTSQLGGTLHVHCERTSDSHQQPIARGLSHKTRLLGQSHWAVNGVLMICSIAKAIDAHTVTQDAIKAWSGVERCKTLARQIKARRLPPWPVSIVSDLPDRQLADTLLAGYLRTSEAFYRVLHIPSFEKEYEALWSVENPKDTAFSIQVKLILAIGATVYDDKFTLRPSAIRWVSEAQVWTAEPRFKSRLNMQCLQTDILLLLAQERVNVHGKAVWVSTASVIRKAIHMGLHRDPSQLPSTSFLVCEMRRRLWNTLLELDLQYSFGFGGPVFVTMDSFDTEPPANLDDAQLLAENPVPHAANIYTQMSTSLALRETVPTRLAIIQLLNNLHSQSKYEETLRLDADLRVVYKAVSRRLHECTNSDGATAPSKLELRVIDVVMSRYFSALHVPYLGPSKYETSFAYSRKVVLESSLRTWYSLCPSAYLNRDRDHQSEPQTLEDEEWSRLATCSSGFFPVSALNAALLIATELIMQIQDNEGLGPVMLRPDLLDVLNDVETFCTRVIEAGETNVKGSLLMNVVIAHIEGLAKGLEKQQMSAVLVEAVQKTQERSIQLLESVLEQTEASDGQSPTVFSNRPDTANDWRYMSLDDILGPSYGELLGLKAVGEESEFTSFMEIF